MVPYLAFNKQVSERFKALAALENKVFAKLVNSLGEELDGFAGRSNVYEYALKNAGEAATEFAMAVEAVMPLVLNDQYVETSPDEVIKGVLDALARTENFSEWTAPEKKVLKARLKKILTDSKVTLRSRAWSLVLERPCVLVSARIVTDLRPVFTNTNPAALEAFTVIHTVVMELMEGSDSKTIHIALDKKDLQNLSANIARAEHKENVLNTLISHAGVASLQIK